MNTEVGLGEPIDKIVIAVICLISLYVPILLLTFLKRKLLGGGSPAVNARQ